MGMGRKILVVDDDDMVLKVLKNGLERYHYNVIIGKNGKEAIELHKNHKPDLVLLDITMPHMNGLEACRVLKEQEKNGFIPIIFLTAKTDPGDKAKGFEVGADDYLTKPFGITELVARVRSMLRIKKLTEELKVIKKELIETKQAAAVAAAAVTINHKINTPLTKLIINAEILGSKIPSAAHEQCQPYLDVIVEAAKNIGQLTQKFTKVSKPNFVDYLPGTSMIDLDTDDFGTTH